jgi:hypothetical protein
MSDPSGGLSTLEDHEALWQTIMDRRTQTELDRLKPPLIRLWDGDMNLRGEVAGERAGEFEFIENDTGTASITLSLSHYLAQWVMDFKGRTKRNVIITIDKQGARWSGFMDYYRVVREKDTKDFYIEIVFKHDFEQAKHILCWANPFLRAEFQFPKLWIIFGPAKWCLLLTLFVNIFRLETSLWTLPDDPLDINQWFPFSLNPDTWRNIVKPFPFIEDNSPLTIIFSRFKSFYDVAKKTLDDAQLTLTCRRYLKAEDPHPFASLAGELNVDIVEKLFELIPLRNGCLVWDIIDNSGWGTETAFGGSWLTGFIRAVVQLADDGTTEGVDVFTGDPTFPGEYYTPFFFGTSPQAPWVVYEDGLYTGITASEFKYYEATTTSFLTGGQSMPGVNEAISAGVNFGGDLLTSLINSALAAGGAFGTAIDLPGLGGMMDAGAQILYKDVILAFMEVPTLRAVGETLPLPVLSDFVSDLGDFHYYEDWCKGGDKAFTLSALLAIRAQIWATRTHTAHTITVSDAAPYVIGEPGYGHYWLGNRIGTTVLGYPTPDTIFVERVSKLGYKWGKDGPSGWQITVGYREPTDPVLNVMSQIRDINGALGELGIL